MLKQLHLVVLNDTERNINAMIEIRHQVSTTTTAREAYDQIYTEQTIAPHWDTFFAWSLELLNPSPHTTLLDVCCGIGPMLRVASRYQVQVIGIDFSQVAIRTAAQYGTAWVADALQLPFADNSFDYVTNLGSLEHLEDMAQGVCEMARVLKPDGLCAIMVPNLFGHFWTIWYAGLTGDIFDDGQPLQRYATSHYWHQLFAANGLVVLDFLPYELPPPRNLRQWGYYLRHPKRYLPKLLSKYYLSPHLASMLVFRCMKKP
ncbi:MAG: class I SAM-dependent methyltransferase [Chloroflexaceae bacterium]|nr:class I SAM-dependent methyltransferase [Chloroflexaceae bacterium]